MLEENVIVPFSVILNETSLPETLELTEGRQYRNRGLVHISDKAFQFIYELEQFRVDNLNVLKLGDTIRKEELVETVLQSAFLAENLNSSWSLCFEEDNEEVSESKFEFVAFDTMKMPNTQEVVAIISNRLSSVETN